MGSSNARSSIKDMPDPVVPQVEDDDDSGILDYFWRKGKGLFIDEDTDLGAAWATLKKCWHGLEPWSLPLAAIGLGSLNDPVPRLGRPGYLTSPKLADTVPITKESLLYYAHLACDVYKPNESRDLGSYGKILYERQDGDTELPFFVVIEPFAEQPYQFPGKNIILAVRGTSEPEDFIRDIDELKRPWIGERTDVGCVHEGMADAAAQIFAHIFDSHLATADHITICGHSLGAGTGAYLTLLLQERKKSVVAWLYGTPPCLQRPIAEEMQACIVSVVNGADMIPNTTLLALQEILHRAVHAGKRITQQWWSLPCTERGKVSRRVNEQCRRLRGTMECPTLKKVNVAKEGGHFVPGRYLHKVGEEFEEKPTAPPEIRYVTGMISDHHMAHYFFSLPESKASNTSEHYAVPYAEPA